MYKLYIYNSVNNSSHFDSITAELARKMLLFVVNCFLEDLKINSVSCSIK